MLNSSKKSLAFVRTINHYQPKQRCTVQALSELSALVPTVVRHTGEKTVSLRSGHNGRRQWAGIVSMRKWIGNKTNRRRWTSNEVAKQETAESKEETRNWRVYPSSSRESSRFRSKEKTTTNKHKALHWTHPLLHPRPSILKISNECAWPVKLSPLLSRCQTAHESKLRSVPASSTLKELIGLSPCLLSSAAWRWCCPLWPKFPSRKPRWKREPCYSRLNIPCFLTRSTCGK